MINLILVLFYHQFQREKRGAIKKANQKGLPGWLLFSFLECLVGLGDAIAFIFRVKLQGRMFGDFWAFFRQLNLQI